jgi:hypothetical protein
MLSTSLAAQPPPSPATRRARSAAPVMRLITVPDAAPPYDCDTHGAGCQAARATRRAPRDRSRKVAVPAPRKESPAARVTARWPGQFAQVIIEILGGSRPPRQLTPLTTERARTQIGQLMPYLTAGQRPSIKRVLAFAPSERVVEMTVIVDFGTRARALAMRLENFPARAAAPGRPPRPARWICTEVETG